MDYTIEIIAYDPKFTYDSVYNSTILTNSNLINNKFQISLSELAPIEFIDDPKVIISNLTNSSITYDLYSNIKINHPDYTFTDIRIELTNDINIEKGYYNYLNAFILVFFAGLFWSFGVVTVRYMTDAHSYVFQYLFYRQ